MTHESYANLYLTRHFEGLDGEYPTINTKAKILADAVAAGHAAEPSAANENDIRRAIEGPIRDFIATHKPPVNPRMCIETAKREAEDHRVALEAKRRQAQHDADEAEREIAQATAKRGAAQSVIDGDTPESSDINPETPVEPTGGDLPDLSDDDLDALAVAGVSDMAMLATFYDAYGTLAEVDGLSAKAISELDELMKKKPLLVQETSLPNGVKNSLIIAGLFNLEQLAEYGAENGGDFTGIDGIGEASSEKIVAVLKAVAAEHNDE